LDSSYQKDFKNKAGIYRICNIVTGVSYIGSSLELRGRFYYHRGFLKRNCHHNAYLQHSFNKHGIEKFNYEVLAISVKNKLYLEKLENFFIGYYKKIGKIYNTHDVALTGYSRKGCKVSEETKEKLRKANIGKKHSNKTKKLLSEIGKTHIIIFPDWHLNLTKDFYNTEILNKDLAKKYNIHINTVNKIVLRNSKKEDYNKKISKKKGIYMKINAKGVTPCNAKLSNENIIKIRVLLREEKKLKYIATIFNVSITTISYIKNNKYYAEIN